MIDTELRIGNRIHNHASDTCVVIGIDKEYVHVMIGGEWGDYEKWYFDDVDGIPLNEECLKQMGFARYVRAKDYITADENHGLDFTDLEQWVVYDLDGFYVGVKDGAFFQVYGGLGSDERSYIFTIGIELECVHDLQNRYYSMTEEELTIKEPA